MAEAFYLSAEDKRKLEILLDTVGKQRGNKDVTDPRSTPSQAPEIYLCRVPCGETIPAISGTQPGYTECCIFKLEYKTDKNSDDFLVVPLTHADGTNQRKIIYNIYDKEVIDNAYHRIQRAKDGRWLVEKPPNAGTTTTTTPAPITTTTPAPAATTTTTTVSPISGCSGTCKWEWSVAANSWSITTDGCTFATTTTTAVPPTTTTTTTVAPPTTTPPTTTTTPCLCPTTTTTVGPTTTTTAGPTTTTTLTSTTVGPTTTTTQAPCECIYPNYCGTVDGECTITYCSQSDHSLGYPPSCPPYGPTTTTTCDCSTSTTPDPTGTTLPPSGSTPPPDLSCSPPCTWFYWFGWVKVSDGGCDDVFCPCPSPHYDGYQCEETATVCEPIPPGQPTHPTCHSYCEWWWSPINSSWYLMEDVCFLNTESELNCTCTPPSAPGVDCAPVKIPCGIVSGTTSTPGPCWNCTSTTTTTTTINPDNCIDCKWQWDTIVESPHWYIIDDNCSPNCNCIEPPNPGVAACETKVVPCGSTTTTTPVPTTTSTTANPCVGTSTYMWCEEDDRYYLTVQDCAVDVEPSCGADVAPDHADHPSNTGNCTSGAHVWCVQDGIQTTVDCNALCTSTTTLPPTTTVAPTTTTLAPTTTAAPTTTLAPTTTTLAPTTSTTTTTADCALQVQCVWDWGYNPVTLQFEYGPPLAGSSGCFNKSNCCCPAGLEGSTAYEGPTAIRGCIGGTSGGSGECT